MDERKFNDEGKEDKKYSHRKKMRYNNVFGESESTHDILITMKARESILAYNLSYQDEHYNSSLMQCYASLDSKNNHKREDSPSSSIHQLAESCRNGIIQFLFEAVDFYGEDREIVAVAINYLDRFLVTRSRHDNENIVPTNIISNFCDDEMMILDVYVFASLGLAIKLFSPCSGCPYRGMGRKRAEMKVRNYNCNNTKSQKEANCLLFEHNTERQSQVYNGLDYVSFVQISGGNKDVIKYIAKAEESLLFTLQWYVHPPTSASFIHHIFQLVAPKENPGVFNFWHSLKELALFQVELALCHLMIKYPPSIVAIAAINNSIHRHLITCLSQKNKPSKDLLDAVKSFLDQIDKIFSISHEFDERIFTVKGLLTNYLMGFWRHDELFKKSKGARTVVSKATFEYGNHSLQKTVPAWQNLEPCQLLDNCFDSLILSTNNQNCVSIHKQSNESELIEHYNEYIRPKLYTMNGTATNAPNNVDRNSFCNAIETSSGETLGICNINELDC